MRCIFLTHFPHKQSHASHAQLRRALIRLSRTSLCGMEVQGTHVVQVAVRDEHGGLVHGHLCHAALHTFHLLNRFQNLNK